MPVTPTSMHLNLPLRSRLLLAGVLVLCAVLVLLVAVDVYLLNSGSGALIREIIVVSAIGLALTVVFTMVLYAWLTRGLRRLADASARSLALPPSRRIGI